MAKRTNLQKQYSPELIAALTEEYTEKPAIDISEPIIYNKVISNTIQVRSKVDAIYKTIGALSGRAYVFNGGGSVVDVNREDVDELLSRRKGKGCAGCSGSNVPQYAFELV